MKKVMIVDGMSCNHCKMRVEQALEKIAGVEKAEVDLEKRRLSSRWMRRFWMIR